MGGSVASALLRAVHRLLIYAGLLVSFCMSVYAWITRCAICSDERAGWTLIDARVNRPSIGSKEAFARTARALSRVPCSIALVYAHPPSISDAIKHVEWCEAAGVADVTLYDREGTLVAQGATLEATLQRTPSLSNALVLLGDGTEPPRQAPLLVRLAMDGKADVEALLSRAPPDGHVGWTTEGVDASLRAAHACVPDPDLLVVVGGPFILHGFNPWLLRVTQLAHARDDDLTQAALLAALRQFALSQQRYGK